MTKETSDYSSDAGSAGRPVTPPGKADGPPIRRGISSRPTVLVVDDDQALVKVMSFNLEQDGYQVLTASDGETALGLVKQEKPALVLLDVLLPGISGLEVCGRIRESSTVPILMVTVKDSEEDVVRGLDSGADDYLAKPFDTGILLARVRTVLRRAHVLRKAGRPAFTLGALNIDFEGQEVTVAGNRAELTKTEFRLISMLSRNAGRILTSDHLLTDVWGPEYSGDSHVLSVAIARLRKKLGDNPRNPKYIVNRPGVGYMIKKPQMEERPGGDGGVPQELWQPEPVAATG